MYTANGNKIVSAHFLQHLRFPSKHIKMDHFQPVREMSFKWCFAGMPIVTGDSMLAGSSLIGEALILCIFSVFLKGFCTIIWSYSVPGFLYFTQS